MEFGDGTLFRDLGDTLTQIGNTVVQGTASSLKTALARAVVGTQEGNQVAQQQTFSAWLPIIVLGVIAVFLFKRFAR